MSRCDGGGAINSMPTGGAMFRRRSPNWLTRPPYSSRDGYNGKGPAKLLGGGGGGDCVFCTPPLPPSNEAAFATSTSALGLLSSLLPPAATALLKTTTAVEELGWAILEGQVLPASPPESRAIVAHPSSSTAVVVVSAVAAGGNIDDNSPSADVDVANAASFDGGNGGVQKTQSPPPPPPRSFAGPLPLYPSLDEYGGRVSQFGGWAAFNVSGEWGGLHTAAEHGTTGGHAVDGAATIAAGHLDDSVTTTEDYICDRIEAAMTGTTRTAQGARLVIMAPIFLCCLLALLQKCNGADNQTNLTTFAIPAELQGVPMFTEEDAKALANATANGTAGLAAALGQIQNVSALTAPAVKQQNCFDQTIADLFRVVGCLDVSAGFSLDVYVNVPVPIFGGWKRMGGCKLSFGGQGCELGYPPYASVSISIDGSITSGALVLKAMFVGATYNVNIFTW
ncbi:hypothetical protein PLESTF_001926300 [Pleodorina starrii]|nr:hypothetical protein PLESTF_001926300 [Pleodorina starrii]